MSVIPWVAILVATVVSFLFGAFWYSKAAFGPIWMKEGGLGDSGCKGKMPVKLLATVFVLNLITVGVFSFCLGRGVGPGIGATAGLVVGLGFVATSIGGHYLFEAKSFKFFAINAGYDVIRFLIVGILLGLLQ